MSQGTVRAGEHPPIPARFHLFLVEYHLNTLMISYYNKIHLRKPEDYSELPESGPSINRERLLKPVGNST